MSELRQLGLGLMRYALLALQAPRKVLGFLGYIALNEAVVYWVNLWALFTVKNKSWVTRGEPPVTQPRGAVVF